MDLETARRLLQLNSNFTEQEVKKQYRVLSKKYHPDSPTGNHELFVLLTEAKDLVISYKERPISKTVYRPVNKENPKAKVKVRYKSVRTLLNVVDLVK